MRKKIKKGIHYLKLWYLANFAKIFLLVSIHVIVYLIIQLPYLNLINLILPRGLYYIDTIAIVILFKPKTINILNLGISLFIISIPFAILGFNIVTGFLGDISYLLIAIYLVKVFFHKKL